MDNGWKKREIGRADDDQTLLDTTRPDREASCIKNDSNESKEKRKKKVKPRKECGIGLILLKPSDPLFFFFSFYFF